MTLLNEPRIAPDDQDPIFEAVADGTRDVLVEGRLLSLQTLGDIFANSQDVRNELSLIWGVESLIAPHADTTEEMLKVGEKTLLESGAVEKGEMIVIMAGRLSGLGLSSSVTLFTVAGDIHETVA